MTFVRKSKPPRLPREFYHGHASVLWTHTFEDRACVWLNDECHHAFREILLHACHRYALATPCYVLMPDHWHLVSMGLAPTSDQWLATSFLRKHLKPALGTHQLQDRAHDHVLRENERERGGFEAACSYVCHNPARAGLCANWRDWRYLGTMVPGYPALDPRSDDFWEAFWKIHNRLMESKSEEAVPALTRRATMLDSTSSRAFVPNVARCVSSGTEGTAERTKVPALTRRAMRPAPTSSRAAVPNVAGCGSSGTTTDPGTARRDGNEERPLQ